MANKNIEWIKLDVSMFDNDKIKYIRTLPDGDSIVLVWVMLLTLAGKCNAGGLIILTENVPYTPSMLAENLGFTENLIIFALATFQKLGMVSDINSCLCISGWEEHQNIEGMDKIREQNRIRKQKQRDKEKKALEMSRDGHASVTQSFLYLNSISDYSFSNNSNVNNYIHTLETYKDKDYIEEHIELKECIKEWFEYKDQKKPKSSNHYDSEKGITTLLNKFVKCDRELGTKNVIEVVEFSMSNNYQGIVWDRASTSRGNNHGNGYVEAINNRFDDCNEWYEATKGMN